MPVDEGEIKSKVMSRRHNVKIEENWYTPAGRRRSAPMFEANISNAYLNKQRVIKGQKPTEVKAKVEEQLQKWAEMEIRARTTAGKSEAKAEAQRMTTEARAELDRIRGILAATLSVDDKLDWVSLLDHAEFEDFRFSEKKPSKPKLPMAPSQPKKSFAEILLPPLKKKRLALIEKLENEHNATVEGLNRRWSQKTKEWESKRELAERDHERRKQAFLREQEEHNASIRNFRERFETGEPSAIEEYVAAVL